MEKTVSSGLIAVRKRVDEKSVKIKRVLLGSLWFRALAVLVEDAGLVPSTHKHLYLQLQGSNTLF